MSTLVKFILTDVTLLITLAFLSGERTHWEDPSLAEIISACATLMLGVGLVIFLLIGIWS